MNKSKTMKTNMETNRKLNHIATKLLAKSPEEMHLGQEIATMLDKLVRTGMTEAQAKMTLIQLVKEL